MLSRFPPLWDLEWHFICNLGGTAEFSSPHNFMGRILFFSKNLYAIFGGLDVLYGMERS